MAPTNPIDAEIRAWLGKHVENQSALSMAVGHSKSWLHKYVNGSGHATVDDLVRIAGLLMGLNLPALTETEQKALKAFRGLGEADQRDVIAYAEHRGKLSQRAPSPESSARVGRSPRGRAGKARGTQRAAEGA